MEIMKTKTNHCVEWYYKHTILQQYFIYNLYININVLENLHLFPSIKQIELMYKLQNN
jgi:hypothetical protein